MEGQVGLLDLEGRDSITEVSHLGMGVAPGELAGEIAFGD